MTGECPMLFSGLYRMVRKYRHTVALFVRKKGPPVLLASQGASLRISAHPIVPTTE
jgi:hypothetical protein